MYREVVLEETGCTYYLKNRIISDAVLHRTDGPARIYADGSQEWYLNGKRHRESGPARMWTNGNWYSFKEYVNELFPEDSPQRTLFVLKWS